MKLADHVDTIRELIFKAFDKQFARLGIGAKKSIEIEKLPSELHTKRLKLEEIIQNHIGETGSFEDARAKALEEFTFTLFNRIAAIKVMESHQLFPPIITKESVHGDRSFGHKAWLEENPSQKSEELEGLREYIKSAFNSLSNEFALFSKSYPYALLPHPIELDEIINAFNAISKDSQIEDDIWKNDDILGWLYESYNNSKKQAFKESGAKTEFDKVSLQSQVYTPKWVVEFLVNNSLGKLYLEMYPDSNIKNSFKIANAPEIKVREIKPLTELKLIDPACGSANFLLYAYDLFYELYLDQIENYGADYDEKEIPKLIIENNIHGIDLDDRAVQLATLGLFIKAKRNSRSLKQLHFNVVSSDFFLPEYSEVKDIFESSNLNSEHKALVEDIWQDLRSAYKFGSLIKVGEKIQTKVEAITQKVQREGQDLFNTADIQDYHFFAQQFFTNLQIAIKQYATSNKNSFLIDKTTDAITFLKLISQKYDVATANPPYTDSSDFGIDLKEFIEANYKKPYKFNTNLYATFIKRCHELTHEDGKMALIHPRTFMFIKTFEDVRAFMLDKTHISIFVDYSLSNLFGSIMVDPCFYVLEKGITTSKDSWFISLDQYTRTPNEKYKKDFTLEALDDYIASRPNKHNYTLPQNKLKIIKSTPFIYWISDEFREKFQAQTIDDLVAIRAGIQTSHNERFLRFWWEVNNLEISENYSVDAKRWVKYAKGGPYNKWHGNLWLTIDWENSGYKIEEFLKTKKLDLHAQPYYFLEGVTYSASGSKGASFRHLPPNHLFDIGGASGFLIKEYRNIFYVNALLNSLLSKYIVDCLNPTVNIQPVDLKRIPLVIPPKPQEELISNLAKTNIEIKKHLCSFSIIETNFTQNPLYMSSHTNLKERVLEYLNYENHLLTQVLLNEAIINEEVFKVYELSESDIAMVLEKEGKSIGGMSIEQEAKEAYLKALGEAEASLPSCEAEHIGSGTSVSPTATHVETFVNSLHVENIDSDKKAQIIKAFETLYQNNNDLEEFCIKNSVNPINVWYWFKTSRVLPKQRKEDIALEFLADMFREILNEDDDGIVPLVPNAGEKTLYDRVHEKFIQKGFSQAQFSSFDTILGRELNEYIHNYFFKNFSDHLNLFMYLPKTPFIWHLSSGEHRGFEAFVIIYKWNRDSVLRLRSVYIEHRERALENRKIDIQNDNSPKAQNEKDLIFKQLKEIAEFKAKIDDLLQSGYNPKLDDGVGKNIAPLQKRKMIGYEVLNAGQLKKYLNADW